MEKEKMLHLPLRGEWYVLIELGEKREEYREIKTHWIQRLCVWSNGSKIGKADADMFAKDIDFFFSAIKSGKVDFIKCTRVKFSFGYTRRSMLYEIKGIEVGYGNKSWGAWDGRVFIIKLGRRMSL